MQPIRRILVAIKDPQARRQPAVSRVIDLARHCGASVEFFHAISEPVFLELQPLTGRSIEELRRETFESRQHRLVKFAQQAARLGVRAQVQVEWDYPPHEAIVRRATRSAADLIVAECHRGRRTKPWLIHLTDWELLRTSPLPVLLLKRSRPRPRPTLLAAVDPAHAHGKPPRLDADILAATRRMSAALHGRMHVVHAYRPSMWLALGDPSFNAAVLAETQQALERQARERFERYMDAVDVPRSRRHLAEGDAAFAIAKVARRTRADMVVMGAVSRSGLGRLLIGNTAERVLDALPCDVLVIPRRNRPARLATAKRGMRVASRSPLTATHA